jgi:hypothetical protein
MYARVTTYDGRPEDFTWAKDVFMAQVGEKVLQMDGCTGVLLMMDHSTGRSLSITLWESETSVASSRADAARLRKDAASFSGSQVTDVTEYTVALAELDSVTHAPVPLVSESSTLMPRPTC